MIFFSLSLVCIVVPLCGWSEVSIVYNIQILIWTRHVSNYRKIVQTSQNSQFYQSNSKLTYCTALFWFLKLFEVLLFFNHQTSSGPLIEQVPRVPGTRQIWDSMVWTCKFWVILIGFSRYPKYGTRPLEILTSGLFIVVLKVVFVVLVPMHNATYFQECDNNLNFYSNEFCSWFLRILYYRFLVNFDVLISFLTSFCSGNARFAQKIEFKSWNFRKKIYSDNFPIFFRLKSYWLLIKKNLGNCWCVFFPKISTFKFQFLDKPGIFAAKRGQKWD